MRKQAKSQLTSTQKVTHLGLVIDLLVVPSQGQAEQDEKCLQEYFVLEFSDCEEGGQSIVGMLSATQSALLYYWTSLFNNLVARGKRTCTGGVSYGSGAGERQHNVSRASARPREKGSG